MQRPRIPKWIDYVVVILVIVVIIESQRLSSLVPQVANPGGPVPE